MGVEYIRIEQVNRSGIVLAEKLWLTKDQQSVVRDGDDRAAFLLGTPGKKVPFDIAQRVGLIDAEGNPADPFTRGYDAMTVAELKQELTDRSLPVKGNKTALIARLVDSDAGADPEDEEYYEDMSDDRLLELVGERDIEVPEGADRDAIIELLVADDESAEDE